MRPNRIAERFPTVTTSDLSKRPGEVLARVAAGERLIVCRHKNPVATLQPLDGYVFQPFSGTVHDVFGWPFGTETDQVERLSEPARLLLLHGYDFWRVRPTRVRGLDWSILDRMKLDGLIRKTPRGLELTGRGLVLRETLMKMEGREAELSA